MDILKNDRGTTLVEVLIAGLVMSVVFAGVASSYLSAFTLSRMDKVSIDSDARRASPMLAMKTMARNVALANSVAVRNLGGEEELILTFDYVMTTAGPTTPKSTPSTADDTAITYQWNDTDRRLQVRYYATINTGTTMPIITEDLVSGFSYTDVTFALANLDASGNSENIVTITIDYTDAAGIARTLVTSAVASAPKDAL